ncbi:MAG: hypothetical protein H7X92_14675 [Chitinophagales bacterium]|nr:hypothetical protein [Hyphomicrobiales bacterium]
MRAFLAAIAAFVITIGVASSLQAHHGWSNYDASQKVTVKSPVLKLNYENPHASVVLSYKNADWTFVLAPVSRMESRGAKMEMITVGKTISVTGYPDKNGAKEMRVEYITIDGADIQLR